MEPLELKQVAGSADQVTYRGKLMTANFYEDKSLLITEQDLERAVAEFSEPIPLRVEHSPNGSIFDGRFGHLTRIWRVGKDLFGDVVVPAWFKREVAGDKPLSVSSVWGRLTRKLIGLSTAMVPRVPGAELHAQLSQGAPHVAHWPADSVILSSPVDHRQEGFAAADAFIKSRQGKTPVASFTAAPSTETGPRPGEQREWREGWEDASEWVRLRGGRPDAR